MLYPVSQVHHTLRNAKPVGMHFDSCSALFKADTSVVKDAVSILNSVSDHKKLHLVSLIPDENSMRNTHMEVEMSWAVCRWFFVVRSNTDLEQTIHHCLNQHSFDFGFIDLKLCTNRLKPKKKMVPSTGKQQEAWFVFFCLGFFLF